MRGTRLRVEFRPATPLRFKGEPGQPLYVCHSDTGEVVVAANHFDAMRGLAVASSDVGGSGDTLLVCSREVITNESNPTHSAAAALLVAAAASRLRKPRNHERAAQPAQT